MNPTVLLENLRRQVPSANFSLEPIKKGNAYQQVSCIIANHDYDLFFNFCDASTRAGREVVRILEEKQVAYTGANSYFFAPSQLAMKMAAHSVGVKFQRFFLIENRHYDISEMTQTLKFPMLVKPPQKTTRPDILKASLVKNVTTLNARIKKMLSKYGGALVEEFIAGRAFTVLVLENPNGADPYVFEPLECVRLDSKSKRAWVPSQANKLNTLLKAAAKKVFVGMEGNGFASVDICVDADNTLYMLEINPNCKLYASSDDNNHGVHLILHQMQAHAFFINTLIELALARKNKLEKKVKVKFDEVHGFFLVAARDMAPGEEIYSTTNCGESNDFRLVTKQYIEATWSEEQKEVFYAFCWPISDDVYVVWSRNPDEWLPINHSCNPNAWMNGLNLVARVAINEGESITMDYATFCSTLSRAFNCHCEESICRHTIQGFHSQLSHFLRDTYGEHVSPYVNSKLANCN